VSVVPVSELARVGAGLGAPVAISDRVVLETGDVQLNTTTLIATMPMRLRNLSPDTVFGPITVRVKAITFRQGYKPKAPPTWTVVNAKNGVTGIGAVFDYTAALGEFQMLPPGGVSSPVDWRARFQELRFGSLRLQLDVTGRLRK
jgi:hypothetical protein